MLYHISIIVQPTTNLKAVIVNRPTQSKLEEEEEEVKEEVKVKVKAIRLVTVGIHQTELL